MTVPNPTVERLQALLDRQGVTRTELARRLGVSKQVITHRMNGRSEWRLSWLEQAGDVLGADVQVFFIERGQDE